MDTPASPPVTDPSTAPASFTVHWPPPDPPNTDHEDNVRLLVIGLCGVIVGMLLTLAAVYVTARPKPVMLSVTSFVLCPECQLPMACATAHDANPNVPTDIRKKGHLQLVYVCPNRHVGLLFNESTKPYR
jgi:hypothetical protein